MKSTFMLLLILASSLCSASSADISPSDSTHHSWLINNPPIFNNREAGLGDHLVDVRDDPNNMTFYKDFTKYFLDRVDGFTDGEVVDVIEHYFWGIRNGLAMEIGALDGSPHTRSMTYEYEAQMDWKRIMVEGDPSHKDNLIERSPKAFSANAAICEHHTKVHFSAGEYIGGIIEFMGEPFMKEYHPHVYKVVNPYLTKNNNSYEGFNWQSLYDQVPEDRRAKLFEIDCIPLSSILHRANVRHVNLFILDVEGGEIQVLRSINWSLVKFDVLCIETEPSNRPPGYPELITSFLAEQGYQASSKQVGRNIWYTHKDFKPFKRPGIGDDCYNGARKSDYAERKWANWRTAGNWNDCPLDANYDPTT